MTRAPDRHNAAMHGRPHASRAVRQWLAALLPMALLALCYAPTLQAQQVPAYVTVPNSSAISPGAGSGQLIARGCDDYALRKGIPCPDFTVASAARGRTWFAFQAHDFAMLDQLYASWCSGAQMQPDGQSLMINFAAAFIGIGSTLTWDEGLAQIKQWQSSNPVSEAAQYVEAVYWQQYAWAARGHEYAYTVPAEAWALFGERLEKAKTILHRLLAARTTCPSVYNDLISDLTLTNASESELQAVFEEAVRRFPHNYGIYFAMSQHYEPRWGGSLEAFEEFARAAAARTKDFEGMGMYARLYWVVDSEPGTPFVNAQTRYPQWSALRQGYEDLLARYPSSMHNIVRFADIACRAGEAPLYRRLRAQFAGYEFEAGFDGVAPMSFDACDRKNGWVSTSPPPAPPPLGAAALATAPTPAQAPPAQDTPPGECTTYEIKRGLACVDLRGDPYETYLQRAFLRRDFDGLETVFERWRSSEERLPDGSWRLSTFWPDLDELFAAYKDWNSYLLTIQAWEQAHPRSFAARYAEAGYWQEYGWSARGPRYNKVFTKEGQELFIERLGRAKAILAQMEADGAATPASRALLIRVLGEMGAPETELQAVFAQASGKTPGYHELYLAMAEHYEPRWGGSPAAYDAFADAAAAKTAALEGMGMYARVYERVDYQEGLPYYDYMGPPPEWEKLSAAYSDLTARYPSSMSIVALYASVACRSSDSALYRRLRARLTGHEEEAEAMSGGTLKVDVCDRKHGWGAVGGSGTSGAVRQR